MRDSRTNGPLDSKRARRAPITVVFCLLLVFAPLVKDLTSEHPEESGEKNGSSWTCVRVSSARIMQPSELVASRGLSSPWRTFCERPFPLKGCGARAGRTTGVRRVFAKLFPYFVRASITSIHSLPPQSLFWPRTGRFCPVDGHEDAAAGRVGRSRRTGREAAERKAPLRSQHSLVALSIFGAPGRVGGRRCHRATPNMRVYSCQAQ